MLTMTEEKKWILVTLIICIVSLSLAYACTNTKKLTPSVQDNKVELRLKELEDDYIKLSESHDRISYLSWCSRDALVNYEHIKQMIADINRWGDANLKFRISISEWAKDCHVAKDNYGYSIAELEKWHNELEIEQLRKQAKECNKECKK